jgi:hypothetical protein
MSGTPEQPEPTGSSSEIILYQTEDRRTQIDVRLEGETVWLNQRQMAELFETSIPNVNIHIRNVFEEGELQEPAVIKEYLITAGDGKRYLTKHYNLDVIISVGYRVKSHRGTQFRIWATQRLREYLVKGFALDDQRLMQGGDASRYFDELLERVRAIRASERMFWQKVTDIYATSVDYDVNSQITRDFFAKVQNKFHYAIHGHTAAEVIVERASAAKPNMGLTTWKNAPGGPIRKGDVIIAKNYLSEEEMPELNLIVDQYLSFAELQARQKKAMKMADWVRKLHDFLTLNDRQILSDAGKVSHDLAKELAEKQFEQFDAQRRKFEAQNPVSDFDKEVKRLEDGRKRGRKRKRRGTDGNS